MNALSSGDVMFVCNKQPHKQFFNTVQSACCVWCVERACWAVWRGRGAGVCVWRPYAEGGRASHPKMLWIGLWSTRGSRDGRHAMRTHGTRVPLPVHVPPVWYV